MVTLVHVNGIDPPAHRRRHFDDRLVSLELDDGLVFGQGIAHRDEEIDDLAGLDILSQIRELKLYRHE